MSDLELSNLTRSRIAAEEALQRYLDACHENEAMFSGWGDMVVPEAAIEMTRNAHEAYRLVSGKDPE